MVQKVCAKTLLSKLL